MKKAWSMMSYKPSMIVSVVGGAKNFRLEGHKRVKFENGLLKIAKTTKAMFITSGFDVGVMNVVGSMMEFGHTYSFEEQKVKNNTQCIGIGPWGFVKNRRSLEKVSFDVKYEMCSWIKNDYEPIPLNPYHTHFILVDNGYRNRFNDNANIAKYRADLGVKMNTDCPVVLVVVEGGMGVFADIKHSLQGTIPVLLCKGTGGAADLIADAVSRSDEAQASSVALKLDGVNIPTIVAVQLGWGELSENFKENVEKDLRRLHGDNWRDQEERDKQIKQLLDSVSDILHYKHLIDVFDIDTKEAGLDSYVFLALFKATELRWQRKERLELAISLNQPDLAGQLLFEQNGLWPTEELHDTLGRCIVDDLDGFVRLLLKQKDVKICEFLTAGRLDSLYNLAAKKVCPLWHRVRPYDEDGQTTRLSHIGGLLEKLLGSCDYSVYNNTLDQSSPVCRPYLQLFIWAVLTERKILSMVFWERSEAPVATALLGSWLYHKLSSKDSERFRSLKEDKSRLESLALETLDCLHSSYQLQYVTEDTPLWADLTCLSIAADARALKFLASPVCRISLKNTWDGGVGKLHRCCQPFRRSFSTELKNENWTKMKMFFYSPKVKFIGDVCSYLVFLILFTYIMLFDLPMDENSSDVRIIFCSVWIFSLMFDEMRRTPVPTKKGWSARGYFRRSKRHIVYLFIYAVTGVTLLLAYTTNLDQNWITSIYSLSSVMLFLRILRFYTASERLGPQLYIIKSTIKHVLFLGMITVVFLLAYGIPSQALLYHKRKVDWPVLKDIFSIPYWQIYGELQLETIEDDEACLDSDETCRRENFLVPFILAIYLFFANVILLNLIIAIFTKIFETVESKSFLIWKYQMYYFIWEYKSKSVLPPPFSLPFDIVHICICVTKGLRKTSDTPLQNCANKPLRWAERHVVDQYLGKRKAKENMPNSNLIQKSIGDLLAAKRPHVVNSSGREYLELTIKRNLEAFWGDRVSQRKERPKVSRSEDTYDEKDMNDIASEGKPLLCGPRL